MKHFEILDCTLLIRMSGLPAAINLRELRDRISLCSTNALYHHFCETLLVPSFDNPEYRNDFAVWAKFHLGDRILAERLGIIDPYSFQNVEELRSVILDVIDESLSETSFVPSVLPGNEFYFMEATTVVFNTGRTIEHPEELRKAIINMTNSSVYFHFIEALRRPVLHIDDFSAWLADWGDEYQDWIQALRSIDFMFLSLAELKEELFTILCRKGESR